MSKLYFYILLYGNIYYNFGRNEYTHPYSVIYGAHFYIVYLLSRAPRRRNLRRLVEEEEVVETETDDAHDARETLVISINQRAESIFCS